MKHKLAAVFFLLLSIATVRTLKAQQTQTQSESPRDGIYDRLSPTEREIIPYDYISEKDVFWEKRIWRVIDSREKMNLPFRYEGVDWKDMKPLITIFQDTIKEGAVVYKEDDFKERQTPEQIEKNLNMVDTMRNRTDLQGNPLPDTVIHNVFDPRTINKYRLKEDWFFDTETSTLQVRILGIAPIITDVHGEAALFWIYYPDFRKILVKQDCFNPKNDAKRMSWDDIFESRYFSSYIIKESNVFDRRIQDYKTGVDALMESEKIKNDIFTFEHDLWSL